MVHFVGVLLWWQYLSQFVLWKICISVITYYTGVPIFHVCYNWNSEVFCNILMINNLDSSIARGGGGARALPFGLWSMQNRTFLVLLRPISGEKWKTAPPKGNWVPKLCSTCRDSSWKAFEFLISAEKPVSILVKTFFFFFLKTTCFWAEKTFEFPSFPKNSDSIFGQTVWFWFKNNENLGQVVCTFLTLS